MNTVDFNGLGAIEGPEAPHVAAAIESAAAPVQGAPHSAPVSERTTVPMTPKTCKAARMMIEMPQAELAKRAGVSIQTLRNYENEEKKPLLATWIAIKRVLEQAGIQFIDAGEVSADGGEGVRLRPQRGAK